MEKDKGLPDGVFKSLKERKESSETQEEEDDEKEEELCLALLALMKNLGLSGYNLDDFRYGVADLLRRGFNLTKLPTYKRLRKTTILAMIPLGLVSSETGASVPIVSAHHFLLRY